MKLQPYQESVLAKGDRPFALHGTGTGKTLTSLKFIERAQQENPGSPVVLITSSALKDNLAKERDKHGVDVDLSKVHTVTHEGMSRPNIFEVVKDKVNNGGTLVIDEVHKLRNPDTKGYRNTMESSAAADKVLGLTGTGIINDPDDLSHMYNLVQGNKNVKVSDYTREVKVKPSLLDRIRGNKTPSVKFEITNPSKLKESFTSLDIYYPPKDNPDMPMVTSRIEEVEMPKEQVLAYKNAENESVKGRADLSELARKIRAGHTLTKTEQAKQNAFASQTSQAAISSAKHLPGKVHSGKISKAVQDVKKSFSDNPSHRSVLYTNKISAGLEPLIEELNRQGMGDMVQLVQGNTPKDDVQGIVNEYNSGNKPILLISDAGAEGLDLKGTRSIHVLNPHFNDGKINQAVGRGARHRSHAHLPEHERRVDVIHYHSIMPKKYLGILGKRDRTIDQAMSDMSRKKADRRDMVISVLS